MGHWAKAELDRDQLVLIQTTLSDRIPEDHSVRLFSELLETYDWTAWEGQYCGCAGRPAIHPRIVAGVLLYGLTQRIRSSRRLEWACGHAVDFIWLAEGRTIDHSTFCGFRRQFGEELKDLFRHLGRLARQLGVVRLNCVAIDGTRVRANADRNGTVGGEALEEELASLDAQMEQMLGEAEAVDGEESASLLADDSPVTSVPKALASPAARRAKLAKALDRLAERQAGGSRQKKVSPTDPEAPILPNKGGGYAPNYTPMTATDGAHGYLVAETVQGDEDESGALLPLLDETESTQGQLPEQTLADSRYSTQANLEGLSERRTDAYVAPANERLEGGNQTDLSKGNVADRSDPRVPVPASLRDALPRTRNRRLSKEAFVYDGSEDCYWCPMGQALRLQRIDQDRVGQRKASRRVYTCRACDGCPLRDGCAEWNGYRRIRSRGKRPLREQMAAKVHSPEGRQVYGHRQAIAEGPFGVIKSVMGVRRFLLRGLNRVRTEWRWICTAYNLQILVRWLQQHRATRPA